MFSSPGSELFVFSAAIKLRLSSSKLQLRRHRNITDKHLYSGATCDSATNRATSATAAADSSYTSAVCQHGHDPSDPTPRTWWRLPHTATDATKHLSVPQSDATTTTAATATDECPDGCSYTTVITSP